MNENLVVVYGSGASYASGYKTKVIEENDDRYFEQSIAPPTDQKFFSKIRDKFLEKEYPALRMFKELVFGSNSNAGMEEVWTALDLNHKHIKLGTYTWSKETQEYIDLIKEKRFENNYPNYDLDTHKCKYKLTGDCGRDFRRLVYNIYSNYVEPDKSKNIFKILHDRISRAKNCKLLGYITFNYDCYLENAIKTDFPYIDVNNNIHELPEGYAPVIKLHGSLNWEENSSYPDIIFHSPSYEKDKQVKPDYQYYNRYIQPAIIPPTIFKQEINDDSRPMGGLTGAILQQWRSAINILQEADKIIFVGYSFPISDFHAKRIFQISNMIRREDNKQYLQILDCIGPNDEKDKKREFLKSIFGDDPDIKTINSFDKLLDSEELEGLLSI